MSNTVTVEKNLVGHFKQASGGSRLGVDWAVRITGARDGMVVVRTYFSSDMPQEAEKKALADKAALFVQRKLGRAGFHGRASWSMKMTWPDRTLQRNCRPAARSLKLEHQAGSKRMWGKGSPKDNLESWQDIQMW